MGSDNRIEAESAGDSRADSWAAFVILVALVLGAVHFVSGWTF